jgi:hypothetical protein
MNTHEAIQKHQNHPTYTDSDSKDRLQPDQKNSHKVDYLMSTMIKLHNTLGKNSKTREEKEKVN